MAQVKLDISMSVDGFIAGPNPRPDAGLGDGGERLHEWALGLATFRRIHGRSGGTTGPDDEVMDEVFSTLGATVMGRGMFSTGSGPWEEDPKADGWWGEEPPFHHPVFILTHHPREAVVKEGGTTFTFVTDGIEKAVEQARSAAGGKDVAIGGGASVVQQCLAAGLLDELQLHLVPVLLGDGVLLFAGGNQAELECTRVIESEAVTHVRYRVLK